MKTLLMVKTSIPPLSRQCIPRPALIEHLDAHGEGGLILVCAPAGFGKTTTLRSWLTGREDSCAWVSLDEEDNDRVRFWTYVLQALQHLESRPGQSTMELIGSLFLGSGKGPPSEQLLTPLLNDLFLLEHPGLLVLDDYHLVENREIQQDMIFFITHLPPHLTTIVICRSEPPWPLHRWRARGHLTELRQRELAFSLSEAETYLAEQMNLTIDASQIQVLHDKTEGWITGLLLAASSLARSTSPGDFLDSFAGSSQHVLHFLTEEVFSRQDESMRRFLLDTSILDRFCCSLCDAVTRRSDSDKVLAQLKRENMFITSLDDQDEWHRYHHLFAELLHVHLLRNASPQYLTDLHTRASQWFLHAGETRKALDHAVKSGNKEYAAQLLNHRIESVLMQEGPTFVIQCLNDYSPDLLGKHPQLLAHKAWLLLIHQGYDEARSLLEIAEELPESQKHSDFTGIIAVIRAYVHIYAHEVPQAMEYAEGALHMLSRDKVFWRTSAQVISGDTRLFSGNPKEAFTFYHEAYISNLSQGKTYLALSTGFKRATALYYMGKIKEAEDDARNLLDLAKKQGFSHVSRTGLIWTLLGEILRQQGNIPEAHQCIIRGLHVSRTEIPSYAWNCLFIIRLSWSKQDLKTAKQFIQEIESIHRSTGLPYFIREPAVRWKARLLAADGRINESLEVLSSLGVTWESTILPTLHAPALELCRIAPELSRDVSAILDALENHAAKGENVQLVIEILLIRAAAEDRKGDTAAAHAYRIRAEEIADACGMYQIFLDEGHTPPARKSGEHRDIGNSLELAEELSSRELDVLKLITEGLSNQEISQRLFISQGTVKWHTSNIYGKLGVSRRTEAAALAHAHQLFSS